MFVVFIASCSVVTILFYAVSILRRAASIRIVPPCSVCRTTSVPRYGGGMRGGVKNWSANNGHVSIGTPAQIASKLEFQPQCVKNPPTEGCDSISS
ncbi:hypothetical protein Ahy_B10g105524 [Arachis hypogaea]|uniref:Uncharacterized protein n=1 Tax=Arachis hypogaea TaxID=3818 RepID=A0A444X873_ARAHY|nr:hypothetical protein Ahy_B10g105524 [Arachis hypogaea]